MDNNRDKEAHSRPDHTDMQAGWPQRPARPQPPVMRPRLDPPTDSVGVRSARGSVGPQPTAPQDDPKETRLLPIVESSRFERGAQAGSTPAHVPAPVARPAQPQVRKPGGWQYERDGANAEPVHPRSVHIPQSAIRIPNSERRRG